MMYIVEQPVGSLYQHHNRMQLMCSLFEVWRVATMQGLFDGDSLKPTWLFSNKQCVEDINKFQTSDRKNLSQLATIVEANGTKRVNGKKDALLKSQAYSKAFGEALHKCWEDSLPQIKYVARKNTMASARVSLKQSFEHGPIDLPSSHSWATQLRKWFAE